MKGNYAIMADDMPLPQGTTFRCLVDENSERLFRIAYRMTGNRDDADDVVQETFLKAYRSFDRFVPGGSESVWLNRIVSNCAIDWIRRRKHRRTEDLDRTEEYSPAVSTEPAPDRSLFDGQIRARLEAELAKLSDKERTAFVLRHFDGRPILEIAETMDAPIGSVKNNIFRAVRKLRAALQPTLGGSR